MWYLYRSHHERYLENLNRQDRQWVYPHEPVERVQRSEYELDVEYGAGIIKKPGVGREAEAGTDTAKAVDPVEVAELAIYLKLEFGTIKSTYSESRSSRSGYDSGASTPVSSHSRDSRDAPSVQSSSSRTHSLTYEAVRDLNTELWRAAEDEVRMRSNIAEESDEVMKLYNESFDCLFRETLEKHPPPNPDILDEIEQHSRNNNVNFPHPRSRYIKGSALTDLVEHKFNFDGMIPFLTPSEQLTLLKAKEKELMIMRWKETWERLRPPRRGWHEMRGKDELTTTLNVVRKDLQRLSHEARLAILDLWRTQVTDRLLFSQHLSAENLDDEQLDVVQSKLGALLSHCPSDPNKSYLGIAPWVSSEARHVIGRVDPIVHPIRE
ncbi:hypothetical protein HDU76_003418 [Blyttiomyces sp. JEL0837]|nr:hypothetical protein HDU76_003418 [Blyttiomyces sp. JEL0837]